jgi:hypothetical protein|tara:strand:+ start:121 stop:339 length:219 start_codon:yes stop_codon:yes gene_type:complete
MPLDDNEKDYIKKMANVLKDVDIAHELTRIRIGFGVSDRVNRRQVTDARRRMGIRKASGRGVNRVKRDKRDD